MRTYSRRQTKRYQEHRSMMDEFGDPVILSVMCYRQDLAENKFSSHFTLIHLGFKYLSEQFALNYSKKRLQNFEEECRPTYLQKRFVMETIKYTQYYVWPSTQFILGMSVSWREV